jgi:hypothetical protein
MQKQHIQILFIIGGTLTIIGALAELFNVIYAPYLFSLGAAILIVIQAMNAFDKNKVDYREQRLARSGLFTSLLLVLAAYLMFTHSNSWVVAVLIYALSSLFYSFRGKME